MVDIKKLEEIETEKKKVLTGEKPLHEVKSVSELSQRQWDLYMQFRNTIMPQRLR